MCVQSVLRETFAILLHTQILGNLINETKSADSINSLICVNIPNSESNATLSQPNFDTVSHSAIRNVVMSIYIHTHIHT